MGIAHAIIARCLHVSIGYVFWQGILLYECVMIAVIIALMLRDSSKLETHVGD